MSNDARETLLRLQAEYERRITGVRSELEHKLAPVETDFAEQVTQRENEDVLRGLQGEAENELQRVKAALQRLELGQYGQCIRCGAKIAPARLVALPQADTCQDCAGL